MSKQYAVFQDESGEPGQSYFFSSALVLSFNNLRALYSIVNEIRTIKHFFNEFHYQKMSSLRFQAYRQVLWECLSQVPLYHKTIAIKREFLDLKRFNGKPYIAYNYFTRLVIQHAIKNLHGHIYIYPDDRSRVKKDNFVDYLKQQLNIVSWEQQLGYRVVLVEPRQSDKEEGLQINDLLLGIQRQQLLPSAGKWKNRLSNEVCHWGCFQRSTDVWKWRPK